MVRRVGVVTGLASEAACIESKAAFSFPAVRIAGADPARAAFLAVQLIESGCSGLVSFGMAGGIDPDLDSGSIILPDRIIDSEGQEYPCDGAWRSVVIERIGQGNMAQGPLLGSDRAILSPADKRRLRERTGAEAVDMESQAVAAVARRATIPFIALRAIADTASERIPAWLLKTIDVNGRPKPATLIAGIAANPTDFPSLLRLGWSSRRALAALRRAAALLGSDFGLGEPFAG